DWTAGLSHRRRKQARDGWQARTIPSGRREENPDRILPRSSPGGRLRPDQNQCGTCITKTIMPIGYFGARMGNLHRLFWQRPSSENHQIARPNMTSAENPEIEPLLRGP